MNAHRVGTARHRRAGRSVAVLAAAALLTGLAFPVTASAQDVDPRIGLAPGLTGAGEAISNLDKLASLPKPEGFFNPAQPGSLSYANSDMAFDGDIAYVGSFAGWMAYDVSEPADPQLRTTVVCPGGQGDISFHDDLLFVSVEETRGRVDCGTQGNAGGAQDSRFRGVRIFDVSDLDAPVQLAGLQACKGSHTHTLVEDPTDPDHIYVYISGTAGIRAAGEAPGNCAGTSSLTDPDTDNFSITVYKVPLDSPEDAELVNRNARVFSTCGDNSCQDQYAQGALNGLPGSGLQPTYPAGDPRAPGGQSRSQTYQCHDITAYPEIGLAAGACQGHGILIDITDPANPRRVHEVEDFNFAYWHSATFNNDGTKVIFTDEWGGGTAARCRSTDPINWGANAIFDIVQTANGPKMEWRSYYKLPVPQTSQENCVAHNGSLIPVPGRDIMVQAWYQGGLSVFDFTDSTNPVEIAFFDRGPNSATSLITGGYWSAYWHEGHIYGSEIARGFDTFALSESELLSGNEIAVAKSAVTDQPNVQNQQSYRFEPTFALSRAYNDQALRADVVSPATWEKIDRFVTRAEAASPAQRRAALAQLTIVLRDVERLSGAEALAASLRDLIATFD